MPSAPRRQQGFTYLGLVILIAIIGLVGAAGLKMGALLQRSAAEQELLDIGAAFGDALQSYALATPAGQPPQPASLKDLLKDPRFPGVRRHLRKLYVDPITARAEWGLVYQPGGTRVIGVYSLSNAKPVKVGNFDARFAQFAGKNRLSDWKFMAADAAPLALPTSPVPQIQQPGMAPPPEALAPTPQQAGRTDNAAPALPAAPSEPVEQPEPLPEPMPEQPQEQQEPREPPPELAPGARADR